MGTDIPSVGLACAVETVPKSASTIANLCQPPVLTYHFKFSKHDSYFN